MLHRAFKYGPWLRAVAKRVEYLVDSEDSADEGKQGSASHQRHVFELESILLQYMRAMGTYNKSLALCKSYYSI